MRSSESISERFVVEPNIQRRRNKIGKKADAKVRSTFSGQYGHHDGQDARNAGWSDPSSTENSTGIISFVVTLPFKSFSTPTSGWAPSRPTGITILPPALSWLIRGGGIRSGAAVTITLSNGACSGQPA